MIDNIESQGEIEMIIDYKDGRQEKTRFRNTVVRNGRLALAKMLTNEIGDKFSFFIIRMLFGDGGTQNGVKKFVNTDRNGLFGVTRLSKPIIASRDDVVKTQASFTSVITYDEAVGIVLNEMALQMFNEDLFCMSTFPDLNKTSEMQITFNWQLNFI